VIIPVVWYINTFYQAGPTQESQLAFSSSTHTTILQEMCGPFIELAVLPFTSTQHELLFTILSCRFMNMRELVIKQHYSPEDNKDPQDLSYA
jgi:hypothetical protein